MGTCLAAYTRVRLLIEGASPEAIMAWRRKDGQHIDHALAQNVRHNRKFSAKLQDISRASSGFFVPRALHSDMCVLCTLWHFVATAVHGQDRFLGVKGEKLMYWSNVILLDGLASTRAAARGPATGTWLSAIGILILTMLVGRAPAHSNPPAPPLDPVRTWNEVALATVRLKRASDAQAVRLYAMVNVAMYDAVNGIVSQYGHHSGRTHALVPATAAPPQGNLYAAAAAAAHAVLVQQFTDQVEQYNQQLASDLATLPTSWHTTAGQEWGAHVGLQVHLA